MADFVDDPKAGNGTLPLMGVVPDMKADSSRYVLIQNCYRRKFKADLEDVACRVRDTLQILHREETEISMGEIETFCKHAAFLKVIRFRSLEDEYSQPRTSFIRTFPINPFLAWFFVGRLICKRGNLRVRFRRL